MQELAEVSSKAQEAIFHAADLKVLEEVRVEFLGKNGHITRLLSLLGNLPVEQRPEFGKKINEAKEIFLLQFQQKKQLLESQTLTHALQTEQLDVTLPGRGIERGTLHPISKTLRRMEEWFLRLGFSIEEGPEIEEDFYNFEALNIPLHHPARAMHDTFYFSDGRLLRTHTSPVQIRAMQDRSPPFRMIASGRVYRRDFDITHTPMFHQLEGLCVDVDVNFGHLKGILEAFLRDFFEKDLRTRLRSSYFPFTEPSAEIDIQCVSCEGVGCRICSHTGWLEILGCGMVHPNVLANCHIDSERYTGFAFGVGIERLAMLRYKINDLRLFFENDLRFLKQF